MSFSAPELVSAGCAPSSAVAGLWVCVFSWYRHGCLEGLGLFCHTPACTVWGFQWLDIFSYMWYRHSLVFSHSGLLGPMGILFCEQCIQNSCLLFLIGLFVFFLLICVCSLCLLDTSHLLVLNVQISPFTYVFFHEGDASWIFSSMYFTETCGAASLAEQSTQLSPALLWLWPMRLQLGNSWSFTLNCFFMLKQDYFSSP